jgi:hypothetical protein
MTEFPNGHMSPYGPSDTWPDDVAEHRPVATTTMKIDGGLMWAPSCTCGWVGTSVWSTPERALKPAGQHADAKNKTGV